MTAEKETLVKALDAIVPFLFSQNFHGEYDKEYMRYSRIRAALEIMDLRAKVKEGMARWDAEEPVEPSGMKQPNLVQPASFAYGDIANPSPSGLEKLREHLTVSDPNDPRVPLLGQAFKEWQYDHDTMMLAEVDKRIDFCLQDQVDAIMMEVRTLESRIIARVAEAARAVSQSGYWTWDRFAKELEGKV